MGLHTKWKKRHPQSLGFGPIQASGIGLHAIIARRINELEGFGVEGFSEVRRASMSRAADEIWGTERAYDRLSSIYDLVFDPVCLPGRRTAIEKLDCRPGDRVLEIGVGTGASVPLYPPDVQVFGADLSRGMLHKAKRRLDGIQDGADWHLARMDAGNLGFAEASFDKVVAFYVISVLPDPIAAIQEMKRVCRPGGDLILLNHFHNPNPFVGWIESLLNPLTQRIGWKTDLNLEDLLDQAELDVREVQPVNLFGYWSLIRACNEEAAEAIRGSAAGIG